jgi:hypothetical protein
VTLLDALEDLRGCTLVHLDKGSGLAVFWNGSAAFLEYRVGPRGELTQGDAWTAPRRLSSAQDATAQAIARYGL